MEVGNMSENRTFNKIASQAAKNSLENLLKSKGNTSAYRANMIKLGELLGSQVVEYLSNHVSKDTLIISTAEDADFLQHGVSTALRSARIRTKIAVFWNNHYSTLGTSVAPIVHSFIEKDYDKVSNIVIVKSVISGSCVVKTNLLELLDTLKTVNSIYIVSPVIHKNSERSLKKEFPEEISNKFVFVYFACDSEKNSTGEVIPGIGGQVYELLGISKQPVLTGYTPKVVEEMAFS